MLLIAWDLDGTLLTADVIPRSKRATIVKTLDGTMHAFLRPHAIEVLQYFMGRKEDYLNVVFSAACDDYVSAMVETVIYPALGAGYRFDGIYDRCNLSPEGYKLVTMECGRDFYFDDAILVDDVWSNCCTSMCAAACVPRYDPYVEEASGYDPMQDEDRTLLQVMANIRDGTFLRCRPDFPTCRNARCYAIGKATSMKACVI